MKDKTYYSIGEVSSICNISRKTLRYYDEIGLVSPDKIHENGYRYYSRENMLLVPVIRYYKQMGFRLDEMRKQLSGGDYQDMRTTFEEKITALKQQEQEIHRQYSSIREWYDLIQEAEQVIAGDVRDVSIKFVESQKLLCMEQNFTGKYIEALISIDFANYLEQLNNKTKGAIVLHFPSCEKHLEKQEQVVEMLQQPMLPCKDEYMKSFGGTMMLSCYHIGSHETLTDTYHKMLGWAERHQYVCQDDCYERYVTDYWTTRNSQQFVTELLIPVQGKQK